MKRKRQKRKSLKTEAKQMGKITWGTPLNISQCAMVDQNEEIKKGEWGYVFNEQAGSQLIPPERWQQLISGNLETLRQQIEAQIPNSKVQWLSISWDKADYIQTRIDPLQFMERVQGFKVEAIVKNLGGASLTGLEIVAVILAIAFIAGVVGLLIMAGWVIWRIMSAAEQLGPIAVIGVGLVVVVIIVIVLLLLFGVKFEKKDKKIRIGK
jgi:hypothetical protein